jgi:hypothetical protein
MHVAVIIDLDGDPFPELRQYTGAFKQQQAYIFKES